MIQLQMIQLRKTMLTTGAYQKLQHDNYTSGQLIGNECCNRSAHGSTIVCYSKEWVWENVY